MAGLPTGTLTFLFSDIEGSTPMWEQMPHLAAATMAAHDRLLREQLVAHGGTYVKGTGDGALAVFTSPAAALAAAVAFQLSLLTDSGLEAPPRVRVALHTGEVMQWDGDYHGLTLAQCHRVLSAIHGQQICLTADTARALAGLPAQITLKGLGRYVLRGTAEPIALYQAGHPRLPAAFPPLRAMEAFAHNLPRDLTTFVGRGEEIRRATELLRDFRLVTLVAAGGVGKSRLAVEITRSLLDEFPEGVWLVELASLSDPLFVARSIGRVMGLPEEPGRSDLDSLASRLADRRQLIVLDNCEHLLGACGAVVSHLLAACPHIKVLATSRQRLSIPGEVTFPIPALSLPVGPRFDSPVAVARSEAVQLFIDRARLTSPDFVLDSSNCAAVARICRSLAGIPLAIELAAGRISTLTLAGIASSLEQSIRLLGGGTGPERHKTLELALEWSHNALAPEEQQLFADLSVFRGGFDLSRLARVALAADPGFDPLEVAIALVERSMLARQDRTQRLHLLEPVRLFAAAKLQATDRANRVHHRHAEYVRSVVADVTRDPPDPDRDRWMDIIAAEHDNIRAALQWGLAAGERELVLGIVSRAWPFWKYRGHVTEGRRWLAEALDGADEGDPQALSRALLGAGDLAATQDDRIPAENNARQAIVIARRSGDEETVAAALMAMVSLPYRSGDLVESRHLIEEALTAARRAGNPSQIAGILASLALLDEDQGHLAAAEAHAAEALSMKKRTTDRYGIADALLTWGEICLNRGNHDRGRGALEEARAIALAEGYQDVEAWAGALCGKLELAWGDEREGCRLLEESLLRFQDRGQPAGAIWAMGHLGRAMLVAGDLDRAATLLEDALDLAIKHVLPDAPQILETLGEVALARGDLEPAGFLLAMARRSRDDMGLVAPVAERTRSDAAWSAVGAQLGPEILAELVRRAGSSDIGETRRWRIRSRQ